MPVELVLADNHHMIRHGVRSILEDSGEFTVVAECSDGRTAVELAQAKSPAVVVMDVVLPVLNGIEATRLIREHTSSRVVGLSVQSSSRQVGAMLRAGADGYVMKDCAGEELVRALRLVSAGGTYLSAEAAKVVVSYFVRGEAEESPDSYESLTPREREVLQLLAEGFAPKQIAAQLSISVKTIDTHRYQLMRKLQLRGVADLTRFALREGISSIDGPG